MIFKRFQKHVKETYKRKVLLKAVGDGSVDSKPDIIPAINLSCSASMLQYQTIQGATEKNKDSMIRSIASCLIELTAICIENGLCLEDDIVKSIIPTVKEKEEDEDEKE